MIIKLLIPSSIELLFLVFTASFVFPVVMNAQESADSSKCNKIFAKFTFDYGVKGVAPVDMTNSELSGGTLSIESDPANIDNQCVKLNKTSTDASKQLVMLKDFTPVTKGTISIETKLRVSDLSNRKEFTLLADSATIIAGITIGEDGRILAIDDSGKDFTLLSHITTHQWYTIRLMLNLSSKTYTAYIDGDKKTPKPLPWKNRSSAAGQFGRILFKNCGSTSQSVYYVDNITIKTTYIPGLVFNSGTDKATGTSGLLTGRTCPTLYYISLPIGWTPNKKWPVFMFNIREGCDVIPNDCPQIFAQKRGNMPFIIVSVKTKNIVGSDNGYKKDVLDYCKATSDQLFDEIAVIELFQQVKEDYSGEDKFYWDGFSAGGHSFWPLVMWRPEFIAAACVSAGNYLGNGGPNPADLGRGMTSKGVSNAPERVNLPIKQFTGDQDQAAQIGVTTGKGMWQQFMNAKATCEAHGYKNISIEIIPGEKHRLHFDKELAYFYEHYLSTHPSN